MLYTTAFITMITIFVSYVAAIWIIFGVQKSISASYYKLPKKWKFLMTLFCWGIGFPAMIIGQSIWMILAGAGICFVGAAAAFGEND